MKNTHKIAEVRAAEAAYRASFDAMMKADAAWNAADNAYDTALDAATEKLDQAERLKFIGAEYTGELKDIFEAAVKAEEEWDRLRRENKDKLSDLAVSIFDAMDCAFDTTAHYMFFDLVDHFLESQNAQCINNFQSGNTDIEIPIFGSTHSELTPDVIMSVAQGPVSYSSLYPAVLDINIPIMNEWDWESNNFDIVLWFSKDENRRKKFVEALGDLIKTAPQEERDG